MTEHATQPRQIRLMQHVPSGCYYAIAYAGDSDEIVGVSDELSYHDFGKVPEIGISDVDWATTQTFVPVPESVLLEHCQVHDWTGAGCPFCDSQEVSYDSTEMGEGSCSQRADCNTCEASWYEEYVLWSAFEHDDSANEHGMPAQREVFTAQAQAWHELQRAARALLKAHAYLAELPSTRDAYERLKAAERLVASPADLAEEDDQ